MMAPGAADAATCCIDQAACSTVPESARGAFCEGAADADDAEAVLVFDAAAASDSLCAAAACDAQRKADQAACCAPSPAEAKAEQTKEGLHALEDHHLVLGGFGAGAAAAVVMLVLWLGARRVCNRGGGRVGPKKAAAKPKEVAAVELEEPVATRMPTTIEEELEEEVYQECWCVAPLAPLPSPFACPFACPFAFAQRAARRGSCAPTVERGGGRNQQGHQAGTEHERGAGGGTAAVAVS